EDRFTDVFVRPMGPLLDAGVSFDLAIGNHDEGLRHSDEAFEEIEAEIRLLRTPGRYYSRRLGPVHLFLLDSSRPGLFGPGSSDQLEWLDDTLASSDAPWRVVAMHHPPFSSGPPGSTPAAQERLASSLAPHRGD